MSLQRTAGCSLGFCRTTADMLGYGCSSHLRQELVQHHADESSKAPHIAQGMSTSWACAAWCLTTSCIPAALPAAGYSSRCGHPKMDPERTMTVHLSGPYAHWHLHARWLAAQSLHWPVPSYQHPAPADTIPGQDASWACRELTSSSASNKIACNGSNAIAHAAARSEQSLTCTGCLPAEVPLSFCPTWSPPETLAAGSDSMLLSELLCDDPSARPAVSAVCGMAVPLPVPPSSWAMRRRSRSSSSCGRGVLHRSRGGQDLEYHLEACTSHLGKVNTPTLMQQSKY